MEQLLRIPIRTHNSDKEKLEIDFQPPKIHLRFKVSASAILPSIDETTEEIKEDVTEAHNEYLERLSQWADNALVEYEKPEDITLPVPFTPRTDINTKVLLDNAWKKYEALLNELRYYEQYRKYITSEERWLEIEPASTTFYMPAEELEERLNYEEEEEDVFALAEQKQRELMRQARIASGLDSYIDDDVESE